MNILIVILISLFLYSIGFITWRVYFLRNPKRQPPGGNVVVSPADGIVIYIKRVNNYQLLTSIKNNKTIEWCDLISHDLDTYSGYLIGIAMTPFSVHRNRIPLAGTIMRIIHRTAPRNESMLLTMAKIMVGLPVHEIDTTALLSNETLTMEIRSSGTSYYVTQIAGDTINRIVTWVNENQDTETGDQYGMIRFGSQCDVFLPDALVETLDVAIGTQVYAGESILAHHPGAVGKIP